MRELILKTAKENGAVWQDIFNEKTLVLTKDNTRSKKQLFIIDQIVLVADDIFLEGAEVVLRNSIFLFFPKTGLVLKDGKFEAEGCKFLPFKGRWKNITLIGNIKGRVKDCLFKRGSGRKGEFYNSLEKYNFIKNKNYGGGLFVHLKNEDVFLIEDSIFDNCSADLGGGILVLTNAEVKQCQFDKCSAVDLGGGIWAEINNQIRDCQFNSCSANLGGGICVEENNQIRNCQFNNCSANFGGGICARRENNQIENCQFNNCPAKLGGGGVYGIKDNQIENCLFNSCSAKLGGGIYAERGNQIRNCQFIDCFSFEGKSIDCSFSFGRGGGIWAEINNQIRNCQFDSCSAKLGGGIYAEINNQIRDCQFDKCSAVDLGGGIWAGVNNQIRDCKFIDCSSSEGEGGGIYVEENNQIENCEFTNCRPNFYKGESETIE